jgi:GxxExxY protein
MIVRNLPSKNAVLQDDPLTRKIIACAIEVHKRLGPGLLEKLYVEAMIIEMELNGLKVEKNVQIPVEYRGKPIGDYFIDLLVEGVVILELKSVERHDLINI